MDLPTAVSNPSITGMKPATGHLRFNPDDHVHGWGRAYRNGQLVCGRVRLTVGYDERLGLTRHERRYVTVRFQDGLADPFRAELTKLVRRRGAAARRAAACIDPIEVVGDDSGGERTTIVGLLSPPCSAHGLLRDIEFGLRELEPTR